MIRDPTHALVRRIPATYAPFYRKKYSVDVSAELAEQQHANYCAALESSGLAVDYVAADVNRLDCVFIEDTAVVWNGKALITRMEPDREGEQHPVEEVLAATHEIIHIPVGATLEGGDVLHMEDTTYVGLTTRTNAQGAEALRDFMAFWRRRVVNVPVRDCLHLKTGVTYMGDGVLIAVPDLIDLSSFEVDSVIFTNPTESKAANCLRIRQKLIIPAGNPITEKELLDFANKNHVELLPVDISELEKGEGSLTCLSLIW